VRQMQASLNKALDDLSKTRFFAPLTGRVVTLNAEEGEVVVSGTMNNPASVIGTIADLSEILAKVDVDETEIVRVAPGQGATLRVDALPDKEYKGRVVKVGSSGFARTQQPDVTFFKVEILLDEGDEALRPGMSVRAEIDTRAVAAVPAVPIQAVVNRLPPGEDGKDGTGGKDDEIPVVFVVGADGKVEQRAVETGISDETHVQILKGLDGKEQVVTGPYRALRDLDAGDTVTVDKAPGAADKRKARAKGDDDPDDDDEKAEDS
jgi:HlyD family secretion protein